MYSEEHVAECADRTATDVDVADEPKAQKEVTVDWTESEFFRVWVQLARGGSAQPSR
jgi:hypothetical protein